MNGFVSKWNRVVVAPSKNKEREKAVFETTFMVSLGCSLLGLGCWNLLVHRSINQLRAQHASRRARTDAAIQALTARVSENSETLAAQASELIPASGNQSLAERETPATQAFELAAAGVGAEEIAERLHIRPADAALLVKVSGYRVQAG